MAPPIRRFLLVTLLSVVPLHAPAEALQWPAGFFSPVVTDQGDTTENGTTLSACWTGPTFFETFGGVASYDYEVRRDRRDGSAIVAWTTAGTNKCVTVPGLTLSSGTIYYFAVRAHHFSGMVSGTGYSDGITFKSKIDTTPPTRPGQPTEEQPDQDVDTDGNYTVYWAPSSDPESGVVSYEVWECFTLPGAKLDCRALAYAATETKFVVTNRAPGYYYYAVFAKNGAGLKSDWSPISDGITVSEALRFVEERSWDFPTPSSFEVSWRTNLPSTSIVRYGLTANYDQVAQDETLTTFHRIDLGGLTPSTTYHYQEISSTPDGQRVSSEDLTFSTLPPATGAQHFDVEGSTVASWWFDEYASPASDQAIRQLAETGADSIGLIMTWYMDSPTGSRIFRHSLKSPTDDALIHAIREVKRLGRKAVLKLHLNVIVNDDPRVNWQDMWAGQIQPANRQAWFDEYTRFAASYASLARQEDVDLLIFGTELRTMTDPNTPGGQGQLNVQGWNQVINAIRQRYTGKLTYSAHSSEFKWIPFWAACDYIGLGAYPSLTPQGIQQPQLDQLISGWWKNSIDPSAQLVDISTLAQWSKDNGNKKVLFTEIGYQSLGACTYRPWEPQSEFYNETCQKSAYDATFLTLQKQPWFAGMFWWYWVPRSEASIKSQEWIRTGYSPQYKSAEQSLKNFYFGVELSQIASVEIVDQQGKPLGDVVEVSSGQPINLYAVAKDAAGKILGFASSTWSGLGVGRSQDTIDVVSNDVGLTRVLMIAPPGTEYGLTVQAKDTNYSDKITVKVASAPPPPPQGCPAGSLYVGPKYQYQTIQAAANAAKSGETICVTPKTEPYTESVGLSAGVNLVSEAGPAKTIIDASGKPFGVAGGELVQGFTIRNADGPGIPRNTPRRIVHNIIDGNKRSGINIYGGTGRLIANNVIRDNTTTEYGGGIRVDGGAGVEIVNNVIINNKSVGSNSQGGGIYISSSSEVMVRNNIVVDNRAEVGPAVRTWAGGDFATFEFNDFWDHGVRPAGWPIQIGSGVNTNPNADPGIDADPKFVSADRGDYHLQPNSPCINAGHPDAKYNDKDGSRNDMGIYGG
ncbi:MAG: right-handed parallel beta-helix repeat-containing protein, partial [Candidatus Omnitrophica bacterium]|nr:right-handed parallel beta-helix repeat-containing protein [Candidatus Omnitrophota bacterium]